MSSQAASNQAPPKRKHAMRAPDTDDSGKGVKPPGKALTADATIVISNEEVDVTMDDAVALDGSDAATDVEVVDDDEPDKAFWMTTPGLVVDGDPKTEEVGDGPYRTSFAVRVVDKPHATIFQDHYKRMPQTQEVLDYHLKQAQAFETVRTSTVWKTSDGAPLAYFIKKGMSTGLTPDESMALLAQSEEATSALQKEYRPKYTLKDSRVADDVKAMKGELEKKGLKYARIVSLTHSSLIPWYLSCSLTCHPALLLRESRRETTRTSVHTSRRQAQTAYSRRVHAADRMGAPPSVHVDIYDRRPGVLARSSPTLPKLWTANTPASLPRPRGLSPWPRRPMERSLWSPPRQGRRT